MKTRKLMFTSLATVTLVGTLAFSQNAFAESGTSATNTVVGGTSTTASGTGTAASGTSTATSGTATAVSSINTSSTGKEVTSNKNDKTDIKDIVTNIVSDILSKMNKTDKSEKKDVQDIEWEINTVLGKRYLKLDGKRLTGWQTYKGNRYFFDLQDGAAKTGFLNSSTSRYYFDKDGVQQLGWQKIDDKVYYLTKDGTKHTGVFTDGTKNYYLNDGIEYAKTEWAKEAINEYSRLASEDIDISMIDPKTYSRKLTKKSVFDVIESEVIRIEEEYKKSQNDKEVFEKYCLSKGIAPELMLDWQKTMSLSEAMERVDYLVEIQANEATKAKEVQTPQPVEEIAETAEIDEKGDIWAVMLRMTDKQKSLFKQFLTDTGIELVGKPSLVDDIF